MKQILLIFFVMTFCLAVPAQKKVTDREIEGLKGAVKAVFQDYMVTYVASGPTEINKRVKESEYYFDKDGALTQILYPSRNSKSVFSIIDGFKTFKSSPIKEGDEPKGFLRGVIIGKEEPIEKPEKLVPPDERFTLRYVYEYDADGRVETERHYGNNGKLWRLTTYKYGKNGLVIEEIRKETGSIHKYTYKYNNRGDLIETLRDLDFKSGVNKKERWVYSDYKVDGQGNWTERKSIWTSKTDDRTYSSKTNYYRTITYY